MLLPALVSCGKVEIPEAEDASGGEEGKSPESWVALEGTGEGTEASPYSVSDVLREDFVSVEAVWTGGYVVGYVVRAISGAVFGAEEAVRSNVLIADTPGEDNVEACLPVELDTDKLHTQVSLYNNPDSLGRYIVFQASVKPYFRVTGLRDVKQFRWYGAGPYILPAGDDGGTGDDGQEEGNGKEEEPEEPQPPSPDGEPQEEVLELEHGTEVIHDGRSLEKRGGRKAVAG